MRVRVDVSYLEQNQVMLMHHLLPQHHRQELVECDVLDQGGSDVTSFLTGKLIFNQIIILKVKTELTGLVDDK